MDEKYLEMAEAAIEAQIAMGVRGQSNKAFSSTDLAPHQFVALECADCSEDLPLFRMQKGLIRCVPCQTKKERK